MRFSPQEISGSRVRLRYSVELDYAVAGPTDFLMNIHAARTRRQRVVEEFFAIDPHRDASVNEDAVSGNRIAAFAVASGTIVVKYAALVEIVVIGILTFLCYQWMPAVIFITYLLYGFLRPFLSRKMQEEIEEEVEDDDEEPVESP